MSVPSVSGADGNRAAVVNPVSNAVGEDGRNVKSAAAACKYTTETAICTDIVVADGFVQYDTNGR
jgi:hypothetical protein